MEEKKATLSGYVAWSTFLAASTLLALCVDYTVNSIQALSTEANLSHTFIGLVLLPIPNCDFSPIANALEDQLDSAMTYTIGKCLQTTLFITPLTVLIAWGMGVDEMTLVFDGFEIVSLFAAILLLNFLMEKGSVTWLVRPAAASRVSNADSDIQGYKVASCWEIGPSLLYLPSLRSKRRTGDLLLTLYYGHSPALLRPK
ncbi:hypothetical protein LQW54_002219 [Pestalotiopsis sp. IQ-011]